MIAIDGNRSPPLANTIFPSLCLPRARVVIVQSANTSEPYPTPVLPRSFEEQLPGLSATPNAVGTLNHNLVVLGFYSSTQAGLALTSHNSAAHSAFTRSSFGGVPFGTVRKLRFFFRNSDVDTVLSIELLRYMKRLECLEMNRGTAEPLARRVIRRGYVPHSPH